MTNWSSAAARRHVLSAREEELWSTFEEKVSLPERSSPVEFAQIFQALQSESDHWTKDRIMTWIYNRGLDVRKSYYSRIADQVPQLSRAVAPPPPMWSFPQSDQSMQAFHLSHASDPESVSVVEPINTEDETEKVDEMMLSLIESLTSPSLYLDLPKEDHELFKGVAVFLHDQLVDHLPSLIEQLYSQHGDEIAEMLDKSKREKRTLRHLEQMRQAKLEKQHQRKQQYKNALENLQNWWKVIAARYMGAEEELIDPIELTASDDSVNESIYGELSSQYEEGDPEICEKYFEEFLALSEIPPNQSWLRRYDNFPLTMRLGYLLSAVSDRALNVARHFLPLPSATTIYRHFAHRVAAIGRQLTTIDGLDKQIEDFVNLNVLTPDTPISVSIDAMAMSPDGSTLPKADSEYAFVIYGQPLDRRKKCMPLHVVKAQHGQATDHVQSILNQVCSNLAEREVTVRYVCSDGDRGYNKRHGAFFAEWFPIFATEGLAAALNSILRERNIPVSDFLHIWKQFLARIKNHPVTLSPDSLDHLLTGDGLEEFLHLGDALQDKSTIGKMRDAYALQCFTVKNCLKCLEKERLTEFLYLLPFTLQQEVVRNPTMSRYNRLAKAILSFKLLVHFFYLSWGDHHPSVTQRFTSKRTEALTFAEDSDWPRLLNSALALIQFIVEADGNWSFSRLGSHCLENFFGFIRQNAKGDDRYLRAVQIIAKTQIVCGMMNDLNMNMKHSHRDNVGGVVIGGMPIRLNTNLSVCRLFKSMISLSALNYDDSECDENLRYPDSIGLLIVEFRSWTLDRFPFRETRPVTSPLIANCRILPRIKSAWKPLL
jgi:hypothetical protein